MTTPTPHNKANNGEITKTVIMLGDPSRVKILSEKYLKNAKIVNVVNGDGLSGLSAGAQQSLTNLLAHFLIATVVNVVLRVEAAADATEHTADIGSSVVDVTIDAAHRPAKVTACPSAIPTS